MTMSVVPLKEASHLDYALILSTLLSQMWHVVTFFLLLIVSVSLRDNKPSFAVFDDSLVWFQTTVELCFFFCHTFPYQ